MISPDTASDCPRERAPRKAMRDCTGKPVHLGDKCSVLKGSLGSTFAKMEPVQKNLLSFAGLVDSDEVTFKKDPRVAPWKGTVAQHPSSSPRNVRDGLRTGVVRDGTEDPEMTGTRPPSDTCPAGDLSLQTTSRQVDRMSVSEAQLHDNRNSDVKRFLKLALSWQCKPAERAPPMLRNRPTGPTPLEREEHCRTQRVVELGVMLPGRGRADPHAMRNESEKGMAVVGLDHENMWSRSAENAGDVVDVEDWRQDELTSLVRTKLTRWLDLRLLAQGQR